MKTNTTFEENGLSFTAEGHSGIKNFALRLVVEGKPHVASYGTITPNAGGFTAEAKAGADLTVRSSVEPVPGLDAVVLRHTISNGAKRPVFVNEAATGQVSASAAVMHGRGSWLGWDLRFAHTDNVRTEHYPHCQMEYPYVRMLPTETVRLGRGQDQAFPGLWILDARSNFSIVFAAASQAINYTTFEMRKGAMVNEGIFEEFLIRHDPGQNAGFVIPAGGEVVLDGVFIQIRSGVVAEDAFADYIDFLSQRFTFRGPKTPILREAFHCTWNYGVFGDQNEASLLPTARFISKNFPNLKWFLMDAGYLAGDIDTTFLDRFYPDPNQFITSEKWPRGIRGYTDELRSLGLRPGLWWSPTVRVPSHLHDEHPDWFLRNADGSLSEDKSAALAHSAAGRLGHAIEPVIRPMGADWKIGIGLISSFAAREVFVSTMSVIYNVEAEDDDDGTRRLRDRLAAERRPDGTPVYTPALCASLMVFFVFAMQCLSTIAVVRRETHSWKWPLFQLAYMTGTAWLLATAAYQLISALSS